MWRGRHIRYIKTTKGTRDVHDFFMENAGRPDPEYNGANLCILSQGSRTHTLLIRTKKHEWLQPHFRTERALIKACLLAAWPLLGEV